MNKKLLITFPRDYQCPTEICFGIEIHNTRCDDITETRIKRKKLVMILRRAMQTHLQSSVFIFFPPAGSAERVRAQQFFSLFPVLLKFCHCCCVCLESCFTISSGSWLPHQLQIEPMRIRCRRRYGSFSSKCSRFQFLHFLFFLVGQFDFDAKWNPVGIQ